MPDYPLWTAAVSLAGGNAVHYICDEVAEWYPDIDDIKSKNHFQYQGNRPYQSKQPNWSPLS